LGRTKEQCSIKIFFRERNICYAAHRRRDKKEGRWGGGFNKTTDPFTTGGHAGEEMNKGEKTGKGGGLPNPRPTYRMGSVYWGGEETLKNNIHYLVEAWSNCKGQRGNVLVHHRNEISIGYVSWGGSKRVEFPWRSTQGRRGEKTVNPGSMNMGSGEGQ